MLLLQLKSKETAGPLLFSLQQQHKSKHLEFGIWFLATAVADPTKRTQVD